MGKPRQAHVSIQMTFHDQVPMWALLREGITPDRTVTNYDLADDTAKVQLADALRNLASRLLAEVPRDLVAERFPEVVQHQTWVDRPMF